MNLEVIREIARERGFNPGRLTKIELVRCIQRGEGHFDCYGTALTGYCDQYGCLWREDCLEPVKTNGEKAAAKKKVAAPSGKIKGKAAIASDAGTAKKKTPKADKIDKGDKTAKRAKKTKSREVSAG